MGVRTPGLTAAVIVFIVIGFGMGLYAARIRPPTAIPDPGSSNIALTFGPTHFAHSRIRVTLSLYQEFFGSEGGTQATLAIALSGKDFEYGGWKLLARVPTGVHLPFSRDIPASGRVFHRAAGGDVVSYTPGPVADGKATLFLTWNDLHSGPLQVQGANLVAEFPDLAVDNQTELGSSDSSPTPSPTPTLIVSRELQPGSDYAYLGGPAPEHQDLFTWSWKPELGQRVPFGQGWSSSIR